MPSAGSFGLKQLRVHLKHVIALDRRTWLDLMQATYQLAIARLRLKRPNLRELLGFNELPSDCDRRPIDREEIRLVERVGYAIPRAAHRLPWRADCLVQALAARRWLRRHGIDSRLTIGVRKADAPALDAHAWLSVGAFIVTGGDVALFKPLGK